MKMRLFIAALGLTGIAAAAYVHNAASAADASAIDADSSGPAMESSCCGPVCPAPTLAPEKSKAPSDT